MKEPRIPDFPEWLDGDSDVAGYRLELAMYWEARCLQAEAAIKTCPLVDVAAERDGLRDELERERMRLVACGVVAMADTPESAARARDMHPDYRSASCDDVARMVDKLIELRGQK